MSENHYRCYCGGIIIADTEDWEQPLCHKHYCEFLGSYQQKLNSAIEVIKHFAVTTRSRKAVEWLKDNTKDSNE